MNQRILPEKYRFLSGSALKVVAVVTMLIDHTASVLLSNQSIILFTIAGHSLTLYTLMRAIGRVAFPLYAFLITEGFGHTRSRLRYGVNLGVFALLSEIPWNLEHTGKLFHIASQNVFFTLFLGFLGLCAIERYKERIVPLAASLLALFAAATVLKCDYGSNGFCFILFLYALREHELVRAVIGSGILSARWKAGLAFIPIALYNGKRGFIQGPVLKYAFYLIYPVHMLILYALKHRLIGY